MTNVRRLSTIVAVLMLAGVALAQPVDVLAPDTWFESVATVVAVGGLLSGAIVRGLTALGKDFFSTNGMATIVLSAVVSVIVGGVGGYLALGAFTDLGGWQGALSAAFMALWAVVQSNAGHRVGAQTQAAALKRAGLVQPGSVAATELAEEKLRERKGSL